MDIYKFHANPKTLEHYDLAQQMVPTVFAPDFFPNGIFPKDLTAKQIDAISKSPEHAYIYAARHIKGRFLEAEPYIKDSEFAGPYAIHILKERWPEAEHSFIRAPVWAHPYATKILKRRWPEAEPYIKQVPWIWQKYIKHFQINN